MIWIRYDPLFLSFFPTRGHMRSEYLLDSGWMSLYLRKQIFSQMSHSRLQSSITNNQIKRLLHPRVITSIRLSQHARERNKNIINRKLWEYTARSFLLICLISWHGDAVWVSTTTQLFYSLMAIYEQRQKNWRPGFIFSQLSFPAGQQKPLAWLEWKAPAPPHWLTGSHCELL